MQPAADSTVLATLRSEVARLERRSEAGRQERVVTLGGRRSTQRCRRAAWHWAPCTRSQALGPQVEYGTAATLMVAGLLSRVAGQVLWVLEQADIHPPALAAVGLAPDRVVYVRARKPQTALLIMEEGVRHSGLAGIVGEFSGALGLTASRRLQLAAEQSGVMAFLLRPSRCFDNPALLEPSAAATRWRVAVTPCAGDAKPAEYFTSSPGGYFHGMVAKAHSIARMQRLPRWHPRSCPRRPSPRICRFHCR